MSVINARFDDHAPGLAFHAQLHEATTHYPLHGHLDYYEMMAIIDGAGRHRVISATGEETHEDLRAGDFVMLRPGDVHSIAAIGGVRWRFYNVAFPVATWDGFVSLARVGTDWMSADRAPRSTLSTSQMQAFRELIAQFSERCEIRDLLRFLLGVVPALEERPTLVSAPMWLLDAYNQMEDEDNLRVGMPRLYEVCRVSPSHLSRVTKQYLGASPTAILRRLRLRHATALLTTTFEPLGSIALRCGYSDLAHFSNTFRRAHGITPSQHRAATRRPFLTIDSPALGLRS